MSEIPKIHPSKSPERVARQFKSIIERSGRLAAKTAKQAKATGTEISPRSGYYTQGGGSVLRTTEGSSSGGARSEIVAVVGAESGRNPGVKETHVGSRNIIRVEPSGDESEVVVRRSAPHTRETVESATETDILHALDVVKDHNEARRKQAESTKKYEDLDGYDYSEEEEFERNFDWEAHQDMIDAEREEAEERRRFPEISDDEMDELAGRRDKYGEY